MRNIFIIGSKGIPANYGGFETFVDNLTERKVSEDIKYHVSCLSDSNDEFYYNEARCFNVSVPNIGPAKAIYYDVVSLKRVIKYIKENKVNDATIYILACRIGPFIGHYKKILNKLGVKLLVNPDGHEWKRAKWNYFIKKYWKFSERLMVKNSDLLICDSINIEKYIKNEYSKYNPKTEFIAYGADTRKSKLDDNDPRVMNWYKEKNVKKNEYYLVVGRFVPENNYKLMIEEFMKSNTKKDFVIITNVENNSFYKELKETTKLDNDNRIKFVGTVYDQELLKKIRENAFAYFHGHEVGGTNPSLLEALALTKLNLLLDIGFNREVAEDSALYFNKENNNLKKLIDYSDSLDPNIINNLGIESSKVIEYRYNWDNIIKNYEELFNEY
ncbi:DUF1972 domain-containing protein [Clostridium tertium]|uniref:Glycosyl transferases group 1 n=1 Tax=Clostridium tertium TaxID=1559 RepID=A0A6N3DP91_9CLOT